jgi:hypothetical protein
MKFSLFLVRGGTLCFALSCSDADPPPSTAPSSIAGSGATGSAGADAGATAAGAGRASVSAGAAGVAGAGGAAGVASAGGGAGSSAGGAAASSGGAGEAGAGGASSLCAQRCALTEATCGPQGGDCQGSCLLYLESEPACSDELLAELECRAVTTPSCTAKNQVPCFAQWCNTLACRASGGEPYEVVGAVYSWAGGTGACGN